MEQLLALEMIRVTEAAAIESARFMGRGEKDEADAAATEAMRRTMDEIDFAGRIVIGEGERDEAPMLYIGERVGRTGADRDDVPRVDIAVDPLEGTNLVAHGQAGAITVLAASEAGGLTHAPDTYMEKLCVGPVAAGQVDIRATPTENLTSIAKALGRRVGDITVVILERPRHEELIAEVRQAGARIKLIGDGDLSAAISCAVSGTASTPSWARAARRRRYHRCGAALSRWRDPGALPLSTATRNANAALGWAMATRTASTGPRTSLPARTSSSRRPG